MIRDEIFHVLSNLDRLTQAKQGQRKKGLAASTSATKIWAKGTGYGMGSYSNPTALPWKGNAEEEKVFNLLKSLTGFLQPLLVKNEFPSEVAVLLKTSHLVPVISAYLRNTSVLDIANHVPLYRVIHGLLQSISAVPVLRPLLVGGDGDSTIAKLLDQLKRTMNDYFKFLEASGAIDLDMMQLIPDVEAAAAHVEEAVKGVLKVKDKTSEDASVAAKTSEETYIEEMKRLQFSFKEMIGDEHIFKVPYRFEKEVQKMWAETGKGIHSRTKRVVQEVVTLSTSLPLSYGSSIFMRCDKDRLDVIKVLITGPKGTPYSNGCFEFDIFIRHDYPNSPPMVIFETTGGKMIPFNPNLFEDGKVCLSLLNTWEGSPEERWNPETSSLLPVLVAIQSMIFVDDPFWNDPVVQPFYDTEWGKEEAREYHCRIRCSTLKYAILEQIKSPSSCFEEVILRHFWMKKDEILKQIEDWRQNFGEMDLLTRELFEKTVADIKSALSSMTPPPPPMADIPRVFQADEMQQQQQEAHPEEATPPPLDRHRQKDSSERNFDQETVNTPRKRRLSLSMPVKGRRSLKLDENEVHGQLLKNDLEPELDFGDKPGPRLKEEEANKSASPLVSLKKADIDRSRLQ